MFSIRTASDDDYESVYSLFSQVQALHAEAAPQIFESPPRTTDFVPSSKDSSTMMSTSSRLRSLTKGRLGTSNAVNLTGRAGNDLLNSLVFAGNRNLVRDVFVAGRQIISDGDHPLGRETELKYKGVLENILG